MKKHGFVFTGTYKWMSPEQQQNNNNNNDVGNEKSKKIGNNNIDPVNNGKQQNKL